MRKPTIVFTIIAVLFISCSTPEEKARTLYNQALSELRENDEEKAKELLSQIISDYPATEIAIDANEKLDKLKLLDQIAIEVIETNESLVISIIRNTVALQLTYYVSAGEYYAEGLSSEESGYLLNIQTDEDKQGFSINADPVVTLPPKTSPVSMLGFSV